MYCFMIIFLGISSVQGCVPIPPSPPSPQDSLPSLTSVDPNEISVGGFSSGASFATQVINCRNDYIMIWCNLWFWFFFSFTWLTQQLLKELEFMPDFHLVVLFKNLNVIFIMEVSKMSYLLIKWLKQQSKYCKLTLWKSRAYA